MDVTPQGFYSMTRIIRQLSENICGGRLLFTLEGGYHVQGIAESVKQTLLALSDREPAHVDPAVGLIDNCRPLPVSLSIIEKVKRAHSANWPVFRQ